MWYRECVCVFGVTLIYTVTRYTLRCGLWRARGYGFIYNGRCGGVVPSGSSQLCASIVHSSNAGWNALLNKSSRCLYVYKFREIYMYIHNSTESLWSNTYMCTRVRILYPQNQPSPKGETPSLMSLWHCRAYFPIICHPQRQSYSARSALCYQTNCAHSHYTDYVYHGYVFIY